MIKRRDCKGLSFRRYSALAETMLWKSNLAMQTVYIEFHGVVWKPKEIPFDVKEACMYVHIYICINTDM